MSYCVKWCVLFIAWDLRHTSVFLGSQFRIGSLTLNLYIFFCICNNLVPKYLMTNCRSISDAHTHNTSGSKFNYCVSKNLARSQNSFAYTATRSWISISVSLKSISDSDIKIFKRKLRMALLTPYIDFFLLYDALHVYGFMSYGFGLTNLVMFFI